MKDSYHKTSLERFCWLFGVSRQAYYQHGWDDQAEGIAEELIVKQVSKIREKHHCMGGRKLYEMLGPFMHEHGINMGRDRLFDLLAAHKLLVRRRRRKVSTTQSWHKFHKYPNLIKGFIPQSPNELWVSDITYLRTVKGFYYISFITDAYSHKIVGYHIANNLGTIATVQALKMALNTLGTPEKPLIHHSDRGVQYCSEEYVKLLRKEKIFISMTESGDPRENAVAERLNGIIKQEYMAFCQITSLNRAKALLEQSVYLYNHERPHQSIGMMTPLKVHQNNITAKRLWKTKTNFVNQCQD